MDNKPFKSLNIDVTAKVSTPLRSRPVPQATQQDSTPTRLTSIRGNKSPSSSPLNAGAGESPSPPKNHDLAYNDHTGYNELFKEVGDLPLTAERNIPRQTQGIWAWDNIQPDNARDELRKLDPQAEPKGREEFQKTVDSFFGQVDQNKENSETLVMNEEELAKEECDRRQKARPEKLKKNANKEEWKKTIDKLGTGFSPVGNQERGFEKGLEALLRFGKTFEMDNDGATTMKPKSAKKDGKRWPGSNAL